MEKCSLICNMKFHKHILPNSNHSTSRLNFVIDKNILSKSKRSQAWGIDLMVAVMIFVFGIIVLYIYALNLPSQSNETLENLFYDGKNILNDVLSEGYPEDWNSINAVNIGILSDDKINITKLERFRDLIQEDYSKTKILFNTKYDYIVYIEGTSWEIGKPEVDINNITATNLIKITRLSIFDNKPATIYLYVWEE